MTQFEITLCPALQKKPVLPVVEVAQQELHPLIPDAIASRDGVPEKDPFSPPYTEGLFLGHLTREDDTEEELVALVRRFSSIPVPGTSLTLGSCS